MTPFQIGEHAYHGTRATLEPIRTISYGLCYKFNLSNPLSFYNQFQMIIGSSELGMDKLKKVDLFIASENTWQGTIGLGWPYSKIPLVASGAFSTDVANIINIAIEENIWNYRDGKDDFDDCMSGQHKGKCVSIFVPRPLKNQ